MAWLPEEQMSDIHIIRQDYARALSRHEASPTEETQAALQDVVDRRARAIRMVHEETNESVRHLASMFRVTKPVVRQALSEVIE